MDFGLCPLKLFENKFIILSHQVCDGLLQQPQEININGKGFQKEMIGLKTCHEPSQLLPNSVLVTQVTCAWNAQVLFLLATEVGSPRPYLAPKTCSSQCCIVYVPHRAPASSQVVYSPHS